MGSYCNKDCSYCDRGYIKNEIGDTRLDPQDIPELINYIKEVAEDNYIGFHGGEPFLYVKQMRQIIDALPDFKFSILTNGTLLHKNTKFLEDYGERLSISISYDFTKMLSNRGYNIDIDNCLYLLDKYNCSITQLQWVIDMTDKSCFDLDVLRCITDLYSKYNIGMLTLIPMRHIRGRTKFRSIIKDVDLQGFMRGFLQFIQMLYVLNIKISVDGHSHGINKDYFNNHKQIILSPDGFIYPEFDFLDYQVEDARLGSWKEKRLDRSGNQDEKLTLESCRTCSQYKNCGIKYLYKLFEETPDGNCEQFYRYQEGIVSHYDRLSKYSNLIQAVK